MNPEHSIFMPKFVMVFSKQDWAIIFFRLPKDGKTQVRYLSFAAADIEAFVLDDPKFSESVGQTFVKIRSMIGEAK